MDTATRRIIWAGDTAVIGAGQATAAGEIAGGPAIVAGGAVGMVFRTAAGRWAFAGRPAVVSTVAVAGPWASATAAELWAVMLAEVWAAMAAWDIVNRPIVSNALTLQRI